MFNSHKSIYIIFLNLLRLDSLLYNDLHLSHDKGSVHQEDTTIVSTYASNIGGPKYIKQILIELKEINNNMIIVIDFNTPLPTIDRSSRQRINKDTADLNAIGQRT